MPRAALSWVIGVTLAGLALADDPHMDSTLLPTGCSACHAGHGRSGSPMLPASQRLVCLSCHGSRADTNKATSRGLLAPDANPSLLSDVLALPFVHPISEDAYSRNEQGAVTCTSCHSPHRGVVRIHVDSAGMRGTERATPVVERSTPADPGDRQRPRRGSEARVSESFFTVSPVVKPSLRDPSRTEFDLCAGCHGGTGRRTVDPTAVSYRVGPGARSYHPLQVPAIDVSPSVRPGMAQHQINCTDCHGNDSPLGVRGPHGSSVRFLLRAEYTTVDGSEESERTYALCYGCHDRSKVLDSPVFPEHRRHVASLRTSCATCHDAHGSLENRGLVRFGEETLTTAVMPSVEADRLAFESFGPGFGACYLSCHGQDHAPEYYGTTTTPSSTRTGRDRPSRTDAPRRPRR